MFNLPVVTIGAVVALYLFIYLRNKQEKRNYKMRQPLWKKEAELIHTLEANKIKTENINNEEHNSADGDN